VHPFRRAALGDDAGPLARQLQVLDVEAEDLLGPGGGLIQQLRGLSDNGTVIGVKEPRGVALTPIALDRLAGPGGQGGTIV